MTSITGDESVDLPEFDTPPASPLDLANTWLDAARSADVAEPMSMTLATATAEGVVGARTVDVRRIDDTGLVFGTSTESPTGAALLANPSAALQVYWRETMQQLRFEGRAAPLGDDESDALFADRSPKSRAATAVARQSEPYADGRSVGSLIEDANALLADGDDVPRPPSWRAWRLVPTSVEFWHGARDRMYRRLQYRAVDGGWSVEHLEP